MQIYTGNCIVIVVPRGYNYLRNNESSLEPSAPVDENLYPLFVVLSAFLLSGDTAD